MDKQNNIFDHLKVNNTQIPNKEYFEQLTNNVIESQRVKVIPIYKKPVTWLSMAAASVGVLFLLGIFKSNPQETNALLALNNVPVIEIEAYIYNNINDFDTDAIINLIEEENIEAKEEKESETITETTISEKPISLDNIEKEDILEYFELEGIDLEDLGDDESFI